MKKTILCGLFILICGSVAFGQKTQKISLENTTWKVMGSLNETYKPTNQFVYEDNATLGNIKFLAGGKIQGGGTWQLVGNKLIIKNISFVNDPGDWENPSKKGKQENNFNKIKSITVTVSNNTADGKGLIKNQSVYRPFRLVKI